MKKAILITVIVLAVIYVIYLMRKKTANSAVDNNDGTTNLVPVDASPPESNTPLYVDSGNGAAAIIVRMEELKNGGEYIREAGKLSPGVLFQGLQRPAIFQQTMGGVALISFPLSDRAVNAVNDGLSAQGEGNGLDRNQTKAVIQRINLSFIEAGLPAFLPERFKGGGDKDFYKDFICPAYGDCPSNYDLHRNSVRFPNAARKMITDINKLCANIIAVNNELNEKVRETAIRQLIAAGWKFVGYTQ